ncbi:hypothetical protein AKO1_008871, partial [Acrasis kona]
MAVQTETDAMHPSMSDHEMKQILLKSNFTEEEIKMMSRTEKKQQARRHKDSNALVSVSNKKNAKEIARNVKFRQVLQDIFTQEANKLASGIEYYDDNDNKQETALDRAAATSRTADEINQDILREESDEEDLQITSEKNQEKIPNNDEEDVTSMFDNGGMFSTKQDDDDDDDSGSESDTASVTSESKKKNNQSNNPSTSSSTSQSNGNQSNSNENVEKKKRIYVKKTIVKKDENGVARPHTEIIRDPIAVAFYIKEKERLEKMRQVKTNKRKQKMGGENGFVWSSNEHRKLQDMLRRWKKSRDQNADENTNKRKRSDLTTGKYETKKAGQKKEKPKRRSAPRKKPAPKPATAADSSGAASSTTTNGSASTNHSSKSNIPNVKELFEDERLSDGDSNQSFTKLKITLPNNASSGGNKKTAKRKSSGAVPPDDEAADYLSPKPQTKRRRRTTGDALAGVLGKVFDALWNSNSSVPFRAPVDTTQHKDYKKIVTNPIDLQTIKRKLTNLQYQDQYEFLADVELMVANCALYCSKTYPALVSEAEFLLHTCKYELDRNQKEINQLMEAPTPTMSTPSNQPPFSGFEYDMT